MSVETAIQSWQGLVRIAGENARVHITGGEPFLYFDRLAEILEQAARLGLTPLDSLETNAAFWKSDDDLKHQLRFLDTCGLDRLKISWDAFHAEFIAAEKVRRFVEIAREVLGAERVLIRWEKHLSDPTISRKPDPDLAQSILLEAMRSDSCRLTGRAAEELAPLIARQPADAFCGKCCKKALLGSKGVHVDPYGNVFNGQCSGMVLGNVNRTPLDILWRRFEPDKADFWTTLYRHGPFGLLEKAQHEGFNPRDQYASKCHLCTDIRLFFFDNGLFSKIIGPNDCYGDYNSRFGE